MTEVETISLKTQMRNEDRDDFGCNKDKINDDFFICSLLFSNGFTVFILAGILVYGEAILQLVCFTRKMLVLTWKHCKLKCKQLKMACLKWNFLNEQNVSCLSKPSGLLWKQNLN